MQPMSFFMKTKPYRPLSRHRSVHTHSRLPVRQQGVVLIIALIVLVALTMAGIALVRSVETGTIVAGNLAFKQGATLAGDAGTEKAIAWLKSGVDLTATNAAVGYYASSSDTLDITGNGNVAGKRVDWDNNGCAGTGVTAANCVTPAVAQSETVNGNTVTYIIQRLCKEAGNPKATTNSCVTYQPPLNANNAKGEKSYTTGPGKLPEATPYYRITSRVKGPKNTASFVETMVHF
jgi:type IV pilus assembly protein PilX